MTPRKDRASEVLGSKSSFVGQYPSLHCVILQRRDQDNSALPINAHKVPQRPTHRTHTALLHTTHRRTVARALLSTLSHLYLFLYLSAAGPV